MTDSHPAVTLLGSGGATPYLDRVNPSVAVETRVGTLLFDAGAGVSLRLAQAGIPVQGVDAICLTHLHADHCVELPLIILASFLEGRTNPIAIPGPLGTRGYVDKVLGDLFSYIPTLIANITGVKNLYYVDEYEEGPVATGTSLQLSCTSVDHGVPSLAYRVDVDGWSVVISGDTAPCDAIVRIAVDADLLIHECPFPPEMGDAPGHTTPNDVGIIASRARVRRLVLTHLFQETVGKEDAILAAVRSHFSGDCIIGQDLMKV
jgi:ribonuclease BN (tRNA processing enzyme)